MSLPLNEWVAVRLSLIAGRAHQRSHADVCPATTRRVRTTMLRGPFTFHDVETAFDLIRTKADGVLKPLIAFV